MLLLLRTYLLNVRYLIYYAGYSFIRNKVKAGLNSLVISKEISRSAINIVYVTK